MKNKKKNREKKDPHSQSKTHQINVDFALLLIKSFLYRKNKYKENPSSNPKGWFLGFLDERKFT